jgi:hypothetical protein
MNALLTGLQKEQNTTRTLNGASTNISTLNDVLDYFYHAPAMRGADTTKLFANAYLEDKELAVKAAFYVRDIRGGQGQRQMFIDVLNWLYKNDLQTFEKVVELVPVYGRWKDVLEFVDNVIVQRMVWNQLVSDRVSDHPSLLAKWMPSENASSPATVALAKKWSSAFGMTPRQYRKTLTALRSKLVLVETLMSAGKFDEINYEHVPSRASALLRKAFSKRDAERYVAYLEAVKKGEKKINASTLYPYELVQGYAAVHMGHGYAKNIERLYNIDNTIEALWKALPNYAESDENALGVVDISGSMYSGNGKITPIFVSVALGIYLAERNSGAFKNFFMTFSKAPKLIKLRANTLKDKVDEVWNAGVGYDTNIQAVFDALLNTAIKNAVPERDMPTKIFIFSDMEFNDPNIGSRGTNYDAIKRKYAAAGYKMPTLVFWNIDSKQEQAPVTQDEKGVFLVAGASPSIMQNALNTKVTTPMDLMLEKLNSDRYAAIGEALM